MGLPGIIISALRGGSGKDHHLLRDHRRPAQQGQSVAPFKKGPDYIDAGWLALAAGRPCYNLDTFLIPKPAIQHFFSTHTQTGDIAIIEGNRGLFDGIDDAGSTSTAELAKLLKLPGDACIDCTKTTRTMAAVVWRLPPIRSRRGHPGRHPQPRGRAPARKYSRATSNALRHSGARGRPKLDSRKFPERHMGLVPTPEHGWATQSITAAAEMASRYIDLNAVGQIMEDEARPHRTSGFPQPLRTARSTTSGQATISGPLSASFRIPPFSFTIPKISRPSSPPVPISPSPAH